MKYQMLGYTIVSLFLSLLGTIIPLLTGRFIDGLLDKPTMDTIIYFTLLYSLIALLQVILSYIFTIQTTKLQTTMVYDLNTRVISHLQQTSLISLESENLTYLSQRVNVDCTNIVNFTVKIVSGVLMNLLTIVFCTVTILSVSGEMSLIILLSMIAYVILYNIMKGPLTKISVKYKESAAIFMSILYDQLYKVKMMKIYNVFSYFSSRLNKSFKEFQSISIKSSKLSFVFQSIDSIISMLVQITLFFIGGWLIINGNITIGTFTIISSYFNLLLGSTKYFISLGGEFIDNVVSVDRINEKLQLLQDKNGSFELNNVDNISVEEISFSYGENEVIKNFSYTFEKGKIYKISGINGKGKTTLLNLLIGLYPDDFNGVMRYNGIEVSEINFSKLRERLISYSGQGILTFDGSLKSNLLFNLEYENSKERERKEKLIVKYFNELYSNYDAEELLKYELNGSITNVSSGELQKVVLTRSFVKASDVMIFDEPSVSLDNKSIKAIKKIIKHLSDDRIIILVSHDDCFNDIIDVDIHL